MSHLVSMWVTHVTNRDRLLQRNWLERKALYCGESAGVVTYLVTKNMLYSTASLPIRYRNETMFLPKEKELLG